MYSVDFDNGITIDFDKEPTPEQIKEAYSQYQKTTATKKPTFGRPLQALKNFGTGVVNIAKSTIDRTKQSFKDIATNESVAAAPFVFGRAVRDVVAAAGAAVTGVGGEAVKTIYNFVTPESGKQEGAQLVQEIAGSRLGQGISNTIYDFAQNYPTVASEIGKTLDIAGLAFPLSKTVTRPATNIARSGLETVGQVASRAKQVTPSITSPRAASFLTNVDQNVFKRVAQNPEYAQKVLKASDEIVSGGTNPFLNKAEDLATQLKENDILIKNEFKNSIKTFTNKNDRFDVGARVNEIIDSVDDFRTGKDIKFEQLRNKDGSFGKYKITKGQFSPYSTEEIINLNSLINDIQSARNITADQLIALDQKIASYYNRVPLGANQTPTPYHAAVMQLKEATESRITDLLPDNLKVSYEKYANLNKAKSSFINKIIDEQGNVRPGAESFLSNLLNKNKGQIQKEIDAFQKATGINLLDDVQSIRDAIVLSQVNPATGSRISDILKTVLFTGGGSAAGSLLGPGGAVGGATVGGIIGTQLTSPRVIGRRLLEKSASKLKNPLRQ